MPRPRLHIAALGCVAGLLACAARATAADSSMPSWAYTKDATPLKDRSEQLSRLGVEKWHAAGVLGKGVTVAVLDSGFRGYRDHLGKSLPADVKARTFRRDGNFEARDSQHGILCGEVVHAIAPDAKLLFANWEADEPDSFLRAVRWAKDEGATVITCSVIMPLWSDGEGNGPVHAKLRELLGDGTRPGDVLFFSCAGNVAQRHWAGGFRPGADGFHRWADDEVTNALRPWGDERVSLELCWSDPAARYAVDVVDADTGTPIDGCTSKAFGERTCAVARFRPQAGKSYAARVRLVSGPPGKFHLTSLAAELGDATARGSIPFPGDGTEVVTVGAVGADGRRASFSACGPNSTRPKPDLVAPVPFSSYWRSKPFSGTSAATPQAAAAAALCWSHHADWTGGAVRDSLYTAAHDLGPKGHDVETGYGAVHLPLVGPVLAKALKR